MPAIEAGRLEQAANAAAVPHLKPADRRAVLRDLSRLTAPKGAPDPLAFTPAIFSDLDAAAAYFEQLGIEVKRVDAP